MLALRGIVEEPDKNAPLRALIGILASVQFVRSSGKVDAVRCGTFQNFAEVLDYP